MPWILLLACVHPSSKPDDSGDTADTGTPDTGETSPYPAMTIVNDHPEAQSGDGVVLVGYVDDASGATSALLVDRAGDGLWQVPSAGEPQLLAGGGVADRESADALAPLLRFDSDGVGTPLADAVSRAWGVDADGVVAWATCDAVDGLTLWVDGASWWTELSAFGGVSGDPSSEDCVGPVTAFPGGGWVFVVPGRAAVVRVRSPGTTDRIYAPTAPPDTSIWLQAGWVDVSDVRAVGDDHYAIQWTDGLAWFGDWIDQPGLFSAQNTGLLGNGDAANVPGSNVELLGNGNFLNSIPVLGYVEEYNPMSGPAWQLLAPDGEVLGAQAARDMDEVFGS
jgi:hypothetical protein